MKRFLLPPVLVLAVLLTACATFESNTGKTIIGITQTVEAARKSWVDYVLAQRVLIPDPANRQDLEQKVAKVGSAYAKYQASMRAADAALTAYHNSPTDHAPVKTALGVVSAASAELVALIQSFL